MGSRDINSVNSYQEHVESGKRDRQAREALEYMRGIDGPVTPTQFAVAMRYPASVVPNQYRPIFTHLRKMGLILKHSQMINPVTKRPEWGYVLNPNPTTTRVVRHQCSAENPCGRQWKTYEGNQI